MKLNKYLWNDILLYFRGDISKAFRVKCNVILLQVTTVKGLGVFWKILFRWKASVYKSVWYNLLLYILLYSSLSITYRYFLSEEQRVSIRHHSLSNLSDSYSLDNLWKYCDSLSNFRGFNPRHFCARILCRHYSWKVRC